MNYAREKKLAAFKRNTGRRAGSALYMATQEAFQEIVERAARSSGGVTSLSEKYFALQQLAQVPFQCSDPKQQKPQA